jgi:pimeloyl-ACP methyl ester carboxylesterase
MIPFENFGGVGPLLHFAHANGYPPRAYAPLLEALTTRHYVLASAARPLWPDSKPDGLQDWSPLVSDLIQFLKAEGARGCVGVGHSLGALTTLLAAAQQPDLFRAIVLIDPVIFVRPYLWAWRVVKALGLGWRLHPLIAGTLKRRRVFASKQEMFTRYRRAPVFNRLTDYALRTYVDSLARKRKDGQVELNYPPEWEAQIYYGGPPDVWDVLPQLKTPLALIYGAQSDTFSPRALATMQKALPKAAYVRIEAAGHLVPMEKPSEVAHAILDFVVKH